jgi:CheY-like chemotaxis protein
MQTDDQTVGTHPEFEPPSPLGVGEGLEAQLRDAQRMEVVGRVVTAMAHDLDNLLAAVMGSANLLEQQLKQDSGPHELAREISVAAERGAELVAHFVELGRPRPDVGRGVDLAATVEGLLLPLHRLLGPSITVQTDLRPRCEVTADPGMLFQIVCNLALLARDGMPGGGTLLLEVEPSPSDPTCVELRVTDTGAGIAASELPHLFEPGQRTEGARGLAAVSRMVAQHGGRIGVRSAVGEGTSFRIRLPRTDAPAAARAPSNRPHAPHAPNAPGTRTLTILLVDDTEQVRSVIAGMLELCGHRVLQAGSAAAALAHWAEHGERVDLLLSDALLSGDLDGPALARGLRRTRPELRVILTGALAAGVGSAATTPDCDYLHKPFGLEDLNAILDLRFG